VHERRTFGRKLAFGLLLATCIILAILLIMQISSIIFAVALVLFGGLSRGFRKEN
jgi:hypothetical protein